MASELDRDMSSLRVAIVHDWLTNFRGSERVLLEISRMFPDAPIYVSVFDPTNVPSELATRDIRTTFLQKLPFAKRRYQMFLALMPFAYRRLNFDEFDVIVSSSHCCAKCVRPADGAVHICYCYTPMRYAWSGFVEYRASLRSPVLKFLMTVLMKWMRMYDIKANHTVNSFIAISREVQRRIRRYYGRSSVVVTPGINVDRVDISQSTFEEFEDIAHSDFYLCLGRLVAYKRVDLAIRACNQLGRTLVVAGDGPELQYLRSIGGPGIHFISQFTDREAAYLYSRCKALIFPGFEDFGLTVVEAQLYGSPVIAYGVGGVEDTVQDGITGKFFSEQSEESLVKSIEDFEAMDFDRETITSHAKGFSNENFKHAFLREIREAVQKVGAQ